MSKLDELEKYGTPAEEIAMLSDKIAELEKLASDLIAQAACAREKWIRVTDKLPANGDVVIVANARGWVGAADFLHDCFYDVTSECSDPMTRVTHWMPMPSWPGEIEEND